MDSPAKPCIPWRTDSQRLISTQGSVQVRRVFGKTRHLQAYLWSDLFTSLVDAHWRRILTLGALVYIFVWVLFGLLYLSVMDSSEGGEDSCHTLKNFYDAFLLSIDTQTTIGFGNYSVDSDCKPGIYILVLQCLVSVLLDAAYMGLIFSKISRPQHRSSTVIFSKHACIAEAGGDSYLMIRVGDQRKNQVP
jgi:potassium inwardly-rectifying channel subfamily J, other